jgi:hypothetical protein
MGRILIPGLPEAEPAAEPWPPHSDNGDEHTIRVDEMFARQLDNEFSAGVRGLLQGAEVFAERAAELTPEDASDEVRAGIAQVTAFAQRRAERQWQKNQAVAGVAALDWFARNPGRSFLAIPPDICDWLAPDQWHGLEALFIEGRLRTDGGLFERLDRLLVYEPDSFAAFDLDRHRLSLDDEDHARFAGAQKAIAEGRVDPGHVRHDWLRRGIDRALEAQGIETDSPEATKVRADARDRLQAFSSVEGREPGINDIERMVIQEVDGARRDRNVTDQTTDATPSSSDRESAPVVAASSVSANSADEQPTPNVVDAQVTDWLMDIGSDGKPQAKRPPLDVWNRLTPAQQEAVDFLLARNARSSQAEAPPPKSSWCLIRLLLPTRIPGTTFVRRRSTLACRTRRAMRRRRGVMPAWERRACAIGS